MGRPGQSNGSWPKPGDGRRTLEEALLHSPAHRPE